MAKKFKLVTLLGIRPDIIRMHKLIKLLDAGQKKYVHEHIFSHTGQHFDYELDEVFYKQLNVRRPSINLNVGRSLKESGKPTTHAYQTALLFERTEEFIQQEKPDAVMYLGDTNSVISSVIVSRNNIPVVHIEGGGRSYDWRMPEEKCRTVIDHLSDVIYCYLPRYREILLQEGVTPFRIMAVGNIIVDAIESFLPKAEKNPIMKTLGLKNEKFILVTLHREENTVNQKILTEKVLDLIRLSEKLRMQVVFPIMPRVKNLIEKYGLQKTIDNSKIIQTKPLGFFEFLNLEKNAKLIVSDSGTVQEEALILGTPCLISRLSTERPETMEAGATVLSNERLYENALRALTLPKNWDRDILNPTGTSPSEVMFEDLVKKIQNGFFKKSRLFEMVEKDHFIQQAYGRN